MNIKIEKKSNYYKIVNTLYDSPYKNRHYQKRFLQNTLKINSMRKIPSSSFSNISCNTSSLSSLLSPLLLFLINSLIYL